MCGQDNESLYKKRLMAKTIVRAKDEIDKESNKRL